MAFQNLNLMESVEITMCFGSSCFARGNKAYFKIVEDFLKKNNLQNMVVFKGNHCFNECIKGPNLKVNDHMYHYANEESLIKILSKELLKNK